MSNYKISALPAVVTIAGTEQLEVNQSGTSKRATVTQITSVEATARAAADTVISSNLSTEITNRTNADATLQSDINTRIKQDGTVTFTSAQSMGGFKLTNLGAPSAGTDATNKTYVLSLKPTDLTLVTSSFNMNSQKIINLLDPTLAQDAATKNYVDTTVWRLAGNSPGNDTSFIGTIDNHDFLIKTNNAQIGVVTKAGLFGLGSTTPATKLDVLGDTSATNTLTLRSLGTGVGAVDTGIVFYSWVNSFAANQTARIYSTWDGTTSGTDNRLSLQTWNGAAYADILSAKAGKVGIGIITPTETLEVVGNIKATTGQIVSSKFTLSDGATIALNWNNSNTQYVVLGGNRTFTFANPKDGAIYTLIIKQDGVGNRTLTWPASVVWGGGAAPTLTTTADKVDTISFVYDGTNSKYYDITITLNH